MEFEEVLYEVVDEIERIYQVKRSKYEEVTPRLDRILREEAYSEVMQARRINRKMAIL